MQTENLFELTYILLEQKQVTAAEMAEHFGVSSRTIYRWVDALNLAGVPIFTSKGKGGGIFVSEKYALEKTVFTDAEKRELLASLQAINSLSGGNRFSNSDTTQSTILKLKNLSNEKDSTEEIQNTDWIQIDFEPWSSKGQEIQKLFEQIKSAILSNKSVSFDYFGMKSETTNREVRPIKLIFKSQAWYLLGWCYEKESERFFKLNRIRNLSTIPNKNLGNIKSEKIKTYQEEVFIPSMINATLKISASVMPIFLDEFSAESVEKIGKDSFIIKTELPDLYWIDGFLLSFGPDLTVLGPEDFRTRIKEKILQMKKNIS